MTTWHPEHAKLLAETMRWASSDRYELTSATQLRRAALCANHRHYRRTIPLYRSIAQRERIGEDATFRQLSSLLLPDGIFKSYPQSLLDARDFAGMTAWLRTIFHREIPEVKADTVDDWIAALEQAGVHAVFSSGTSGNLSFVPRDDYAWKLFREGPLHYVMVQLARLGVVGRIKGAAARVAGQWLAPETFQRIFERLGLDSFDGIFLNFKGGNQGIQLVGQQLAQRVRKATFLYPTEISATAIRTISRGAGNAVEKARAEAFLDLTVRDKDRHYERLVAAARAAVRDQQRVLMFGAPYLVKELCDRLLADGGPLALAPGSIVGYGGGWKSFNGERLSEPALRELIARATGVEAPFVVEAYSMTEIGALMMKCAHGRFHVPPHLETIVLDPALEPIEGDDVEGILGVMDPFATSYPGFLVTGDAVHRTRQPCECGLSGDTILSVSRAAGAEIKGCGGIMAAVNA